MIGTNDLDTKAVLLGKLMGLLADADGISVNPDWFQHPVSSIAGGTDPKIDGVGTRLHHLVSLIDSIFGPAVKEPPGVVPDAAWYAIPDTGNEDTTPFHLVIPKSGDSGAPKSGQIGLGMFHRSEVGLLTITAYFYAPLFSYSPTGTTFLFTSAGHPLRVGVHVTAEEPFAVAGVTFAGMSAEGSIHLNGALPEIRIEFEKLAGTTRPATYSSLEALLDPTVESWIGEAIVRSGYWLDRYIGGTAVTVGQVLEAAHFLARGEDDLYHLDIRNLKGSPTEIALNFLFAGMEALSALDAPLAKLPGGGVYVQHRESTGDYGLRISAMLELPIASGGNGTAPPVVDFALGEWLAGEGDDDNWMSRITGATTHRPGLSIYAIRRSADGRLSFAPGFDMTSLGLNIQGGGDAPLFDINGYTLRGADIRTYLSSEGWPFGFIIRLDNVGIPLAPDFSGAQEGSNPVVGSLLASSDPWEESSPETRSATNPAFSAQAGYVSGHSPLLEIFDPEGSPSDVIWFPIQRRFGPVDCRKVGLRIAATGSHADDPMLGIVFDGGVELGPLSIHLDQLSVDAHLKRITDVSGYGLDLQGLDVQIDTQGVELRGGLLKRTDSDGTVSYDGEAMLKYQDIVLAAFGSYTSLPDGGGTSLFIFAMLNRPIGGPSFFYVTGLSAGFGYNRTLRLPAMDSVQSFPLVAGLSNPSAIGGDDPSPGEALAKLADWVPPSRGDYWLAAGVQFTTFEIINSNALLIVQFGNELIVSVLGVSTLRQPQSGTPYVYAQLGIRVVFRPDKGELEASAVLAPGSFVLTPSAKLTGGFAFHAWFDNNAEHPGDFVFTIGGYHPAFTVPDHYPRVPRVGINWQVSESISIVGSAYFAITPSAMMAGGRLELSFSKGALKAWLKAQADVILFWKPFYLIADVSVSVGVSYRINVLFVDVTLSVEIGATFHLWGPPIGGSVEIDWYVISFTIGFGSSMSVPNELSWAQFREMLPHKTEKAQAPRRAVLHAPAGAAAIGTAGAHLMESPVTDSAAGLLSNDAPAATQKTPAFLNITGGDGPQEIRQIDGISLWLVRAGHFRFSVGSAVPASTIVVESQAAADNRVIAGRQVAMRRVNGGISTDNYRSTQTVTILRLKQNGTEDIRRCMATSADSSRCTARPIDIREWEIDSTEKNLPQALWGPTASSGVLPGVSAGDQTIAGTIGVTMSPKARAATNCTPEMVIADVFADRVINPDDMYRLPLSRSRKPVQNVPAAADTFADIAHIADAAVATRRSAVFAALQKLGVNGWSNEPLPKMAKSPGQAFADEPMEGTPVPTRSLTRSSI